MWLSQTSFVLRQSFWGEMGSVGDGGGLGPQGSLEAPLPPSQTPRASAGWGVVPDRPLPWGCQARVLRGDCKWWESTGESLHFALRKENHTQVRLSELVKAVKIKISCLVKNILEVIAILFYVCFIELKIFHLPPRS